MNWYCYICGKIIKNVFYLCSMNNQTDRVFLSCNKCYNKCADDIIKIKVRKINEKKL